MKRITEIQREMADTANSKESLYHTMMECQFLHYIDTQIFETIEKLEKIDTTPEGDGNYETGYSRFNTGHRL